MSAISEQIKQKVSSFFSARYSISPQKIEVLKTTNPEFGDLYTNGAMIGGKILSKSPLDVANELKCYLGDSEEYSVEVVSPGFVNFRFSPKYLTKELREILKNTEKYGSSDLTPVFGKSKVVVEYSSPNIAKPFGIGHLRSTIIGDVAANLLCFAGIDVIRDNHLGDWGTQFGKLIYAIRQWGNENDISLSQSPIKDLFNLYVRFHAEAEVNPDLEDEGRAWFKKLEAGDPEAKRVWKLCIDLSLKEFNRVYSLLGVKFDTLLGESFFEDKMSPIVAELEEKKFLTESEGAKLVFFKDDKYPPLMIIKKDGTTLYATRDLATDKYRLQTYGEDTRIINEVGAEQSLYFNQLIELEKMLGWVKEGQKVHLKHGLYRFKDRKMSTRKGDIIWLDDILSTAVEKASAYNKDVAWEVAVGAIKWNDLKTECHKDVIFDWDEMLNLKGNTGPYVQYTKARAESILRKSEKQLSDLPTSTEYNNIELELARELSQFPQVIKDCTLELAPHHLCHYLFNLSQSYNQFYDQHRIIGSDREIQGLVVSKCVSVVITQGLKLLGISSPSSL